ncbi:MAG: calcium-binding protein, partial [Pseudomonadota bacterium]
VFADGFGVDEIRDFQLNGGDVIDLAAVSAITSFTDLQNNHLSQDGADAVITAGANSIRLTGIDENDLTAGDFDFLA